MLGSRCPVAGRQSSIRQETLTVLARVALGAGAPGGARAPSTPGASSPTPALGIHFARLAVIPGTRPCAGSSRDARFESNFDTPLVDATDARRAHLSRWPTGAAARSARSSPAARGSAATLRPGSSAAYWTRSLVPATATLPGARRSPRRADPAREPPPRGRSSRSSRPRAHASPARALRADQRSTSARAPHPTRLLAGLDIDGPPPALPDPAVRSRHLRESWQPWLTSSKLKDVAADRWRGRGRSCSSGSLTTSSTTYAGTRSSGRRPTWRASRPSRPPRTTARRTR